MAKKDSIQSKFTDGQLQKLEVAFNEVKGYDNTPDNLNDFIQGLQDPDKGRQRIKVVHDKLKKYDNVTDDVGEFASQLGIQKKNQSFQDSSSAGSEDQQLPEPTTDPTYEEGIEGASFDQERKPEETKEERDKKLSEMPVTRDDIKENLSRLDSTFNELKTEYDSTYAELKDMQQEVVLGMPGEGRYKKNEDGELVQMSEEEIEQRDRKMEDLKDQVEYKGSLIFNSNDLNEKTQDLVKLSENPEGFKAFGEGVGSGVVNYFKDYKRLVNEVGGKKAIEELRNKIDRANKGEDVQFSESEKLFIRSTQNHMQAVEELKDKVPFSAEVGQAVGQSLAFMGEFALTGGAGKGILSGAKGLKGFKGVAAKVGRTTARSGVQTLKMPTFMKRSVRNIADEEEKNVVKDVWNSFYDTYWEVLPERMFMGTLGQGGTWADKALGRMGSALAGRRGAKGVLKGFLEETTEEEISRLMHSVKKRDSFAGVMEDMGNIDEQLKTVASVGVITGVLGGANVTLPKAREFANNSIAKYKLKKAGNRIDRDVKDYVDAAVEDENTSLDDMVKAVEGIAKDYSTVETLNDEESKQRMSDVMEYAGWKIRNTAYERMSEAEKEKAKEIEKGQQVSSQSIQSTQKQKTTSTPEKKKEGSQKAKIKPEGKEESQEIQEQKEQVRSVNDQMRRSVFSGEEYGTEQVEEPSREQLDQAKENLHLVPSEEAKYIIDPTHDFSDNFSDAKDQIKAYHKRKVSDAIEQGKYVPEEVLGEYPDLQKQYEQKQPEQPKQEAKEQPKRPETQPESAYERPNFDESIKKADETGKDLLVKAKNVEKKIMDIEVDDKYKSRDQKVKEARDALTQFIKDNRKQLEKVSGRAVPNMLRKVNEIKTEKSYNNALNYINKYLSDQAFREQEEQRDSMIGKVFKGVSEDALVKKEGGREKAKKKGQVFSDWVSRARRIRKLIGSSDRVVSEKDRKKHQRAQEAEQMLQDNKDLREIAKTLDMRKYENKSQEKLRQDIEAKIEKDMRPLEEGQRNFEQAVETATNVKKAIENIETELNSTEPDLTSISAQVNQVSETDEKTTIKSEAEAEVALQMLRQDLRFFGLESMSNAEVEKRLEEFKDIQNKTFEDVKQEIEERNEQYRKLLDWVMGRIDPKGKTNLDTRERLRRRRKWHRLFHHFGVNNFWSILDIMDTKSEDPLSGELVQHFINVIRQGDIKHADIMQQFTKDLDELQKEVFDTDKPFEVMKELQVAPNAPKENLREKAKRKLQLEGRIVTEEVAVKNDKGEVIDYLPLNQMVAVKKWLELQDPTLEETFFTEPWPDKNGRWHGMGYTEHHVRTIEDYLRDDVKEYGRRVMNELLPKYYEMFNETYRKMNGVDLPRNEFYTPIFRGNVGQGTVDPNVLINQRDMWATVNNGHTIERQGSTLQLKYVDLHETVSTYLRKMAHYTAYAEPVKEVGKVFKHSPKVRDAVENLYSRSILNEIDGFIEDLSENKREAQWGLIDTFRKNYIIASLGAKFNQFPKQFMSVMAGVDYLGIDGFGQALRDFAKNPKKNWGEVMSNPLLKSRLERGNFDLDAAQAMAQDWTRSSKTSNWKNKLMLPTKYGDIAPITVLYPKYKEKALQEAKNRGMEGEQAEEWATNKATHEVLMWQQSTSMSDLSNIQRRPGVGRLLVMYATSPLSYHRKAVSGLRHIVSGAKQGDKAKIKKGIKAAVVGHIILPQLYQFALNGFRWDDDDQERALLLGNLNSLPATGSVIAHVFYQLYDLPFDFNISPVESLVRYGEKAFQSANKLAEALKKEEEKLTFDEIWSLSEEIARTPAFAMGLPWGAEGHITGLKDIARGYTNNWVEDVQRALGWSQWQATPGKAILDPVQKQVMYSIMNDETAVQMKRRIIENKGGRHWEEYKGQYFKEYTLRKRFDPTYTDEFITDLYEAQSNEDKTDVLLKKAKAMPRPEFMRLLYGLAEPMELTFDERDEEVTRSYQGLIDDEVVWDVVKKLNEED